MKEREASEANKHSHKLSRVNLHVCSTCGRLIASTFGETKTGEIVIEELELDFKIVSSRIGRLSTTTPHDSRHRKQPFDSIMTVEDTCW